MWEKFYKKRGRFYLSPHPQFGKVLSLFKDYRTHSVLDLACGSGRHSIELAKENFSVTGIDLSKEAIRLARKWAKKEKLKVQFKIGNIYKKFSFEDNAFDGVLAIDALHYGSTSDLHFTLDEIVRVLRKKGILFITLPTPICTSYVPHLTFSKDEAKDIILEHFQIVRSFPDIRGFLCIFAIQNKQ